MLCLVLPLLIVTSFASCTLVVSDIFTASNSWEGYGEGTITVSAALAPRIWLVGFSEASISPGNWVTMEVRATNDGDEAYEQTMHIGLPFNPPQSDVKIRSTNLDNVTIYPAGSSLKAGYGQYQITSKYLIVHGYHLNWKEGEERYLIIDVKFPDVDTCTFEIKSVACAWNGTGWEWTYHPSSGMIDQQDEYVNPYLILRKFQVSVLPGGTTPEISISVTNYNRYPYKKMQPSITVESFSVLDYGGFKGSITATNLPLTISPGSTGTIKIKVSAASDCPFGTYSVIYEISGTP